eukprot:TRINITY_DN5417_c0_g1_i1.p1 TRINITY_DN5417_c0_g1~~TRINITY_DN5417_c0_g1_i1.p1  ORF type:complete len:362 (+),score=93.53 TRINITY_DN5417_c0_g1_i1:226-1311(+)
MVKNRVSFSFCPWCGNQFDGGDVTHCVSCGSERGNEDGQSLPPSRSDGAVRGRGRGRGGRVATDSSYQPEPETVARPQAVWRKVLYEKQPFEDNYVDETFLIGLKTNVNKRTYDLRTVVKESTTISQQISLVGLFLIVFLGTFYNKLPVEVLIALDTVLTGAFGCIVHLLAESSGRLHIFVESATTFVLLFATLLGLSPVLRTLTNSFSDDTIWVLTIILLLIHLFFHDYSYSYTSITRFMAPASLNAAVFASVLLGSRLPSNLHVFALIFFAIELFVFAPHIRDYIKRHSDDAHIALTAVMVATTACLLLLVSTIGAILYVFLIGFITFVCPFLLIRIQKYKNEINGPWDEAVPSLPSHK